MSNINKLKNGLKTTVIKYPTTISKDSYKELWDNAPVAYHTLDTSGIIIKINKTGAKLLGYQAEEMVGRAIFDFILPEQKEDAEKRFQKKIQGIIMPKAQNRVYLNKNGQKIYVSIDDILEYSGQGDIIGIRTTMIDITQRQLNEKQIRHSHKTQTVLNNILKISLEKIPLNEMLKKIFNALISVSWIALESRGGIWLAIENKNKLVLTVHRGLSRDLQIKCSHIPFGTCICGQTAQSAKLQFASQACDYHKTQTNNITPHGHYCVPIKIQDKILGIINFYLKEGHRYNKKEADFLTAASNVIASIIERNKAKEELKKSEAKFRNLINNAEAGVAMLNRRGQITFANQALCKILGYNRFELFNKDFIALLHPRDKKFVAARFVQRISGQKIAPTYEFRIKDKHGHTKYLSYSGSSIIENNNIIGVQAIVNDITETKKLQQKIIQDKQHYEKVINSIQDGIVVVKKDLTIASCNKIFAQKVGRRMVDIKGRSCYDILPAYETKSLLNNCSQKIVAKICGPNSIFKTGQASQLTEKCRDIKGDDHYHLTSIYPDKDIKGRVYQAVIAIRDITEQKKAEEEIRRLSEFNQRILDTSPISIVVLDQKARIISANYRANNLMGSNNNILIGQKLTATEEIKNNKELQTLYAALLNTGKPFYFDNLSYIAKKTGYKRHLNIIAVPLFDNNNNIEGAISMAVDNTEAVRAKQKLEDLNQNLEHKVNERTKELGQINKKLEQVLTLKSKFIADASHELRTPLTVVQGSLDLALKEAEQSTAKAPAVYEIIISEVRRMSKILSDLTMLTNFDSNNEQFLHEDVDIDELLDAVNLSLKILANQKNINLIHKKNSKVINILGDSAKLEKLFLNIVRNAIKYSEPRGIIEIWSDSYKSHALVHIKDSGIGIPKKDLPFIFERFYRVDKARSRAEGGSGLGLSIAKWIAECHKGDIMVESRVGEGSKFTIILPYNYKSLD